MAQRTYALLVAVAILAGTTLLNPKTVAAQSSSQGGTFAVGINGGGRWPDAAYDPVNKVYLVVSGNSSFIRGAWVSDDGAPLGTGFAIHDPAPYAQAPRVTYSPDAGGFLVTWHQSGAGNPTAIFSRLVRYNGAWGPPVQVSNGYSAFWEMGAAVAYSTASKEFLVAWRGANQAMVFGRRLDANGGLIGNEFTIPATFLQRDPAVGYNPVSNEFIVGFAGYDDFAAHAGFQRIKAGTGEFVGFTNTLGSPSVATYIPEIACTPVGKCLIVWYQRSRTSAVFYGRVVNADGSMTTDAPIPITTAFAFYDALGIAHNQASNAYFLITHSPNSYEDTGLEISPDGVPSPHFLVTNTGNVRGNFNPRVTANVAKAEWLVATSFNLTNIVAQRVGTSSVYPGGGGGEPPPPPPPPPPPVTIDLSPAAAPNGSWFLAEGVASNLGGGFDTYYLIANPNTDSDVSVTAYFSKSDGTTVKTTKTVPAGSRATFPLRDIAGLGSFGAVIQSTTPGKQIFVERSIYFGAGWEGSASETATDTASTTWYFAEGSRRAEYFNNYFLLFNPTQTPASVNATFYTENGTSVTRSLTVGAQSRETLDANGIPELAGLDFSTTLTSTQPVVAERAMYFATTRGTMWTGGMAAIGTTAPAGRWLFAEGAAAPGFDTFYTVLNPNAYPVQLTVNYLREFGGIATRSYTLDANKRYTYHLTSELGFAGGVASEFLATGGGVIVERSTYWGTNPGWVEGTTVMGVNSPACEWHVPEGSLVGGFDAYLLLGNPNGTAAQLNVTVLLENGAAYTLYPPVTVEPYSRRSINMANFFPVTEEWANAQTLLNNSSFSTRVTCSGGSVPVVVEHALYLTPDPANYWRSGSAAFGEAR